MQFQSAWPGSASRWTPSSSSKRGPTKMRIRMRTPPRPTTGDRRKTLRITIGGANRACRAILLAVCAFSASSAHADGTLACEREMTRAAARTGVPLNVLYSVGLTETGRRGELSPFDLNIDGRDVHSGTLAEAMARFALARARGARLIDIGCMQINHRWHAAHFGALSEMFDPARNVEYAASFLKSLRAQEGNWTL